MARVATHSCGHSSPNVPVGYSPQLTLVKGKKTLSNSRGVFRGESEPAPARLSKRRFMHVVGCVWNIATKVILWFSKVPKGVFGLRCSLGRFARQWWLERIPEKGHQKIHGPKLKSWIRSCVLRVTTKNVVNFLRKKCIREFATPPLWKKIPRAPMDWHVLCCRWRLAIFVVGPSVRACVRGQVCQYDILQTACGNFTKFTV